MLRRREFIAAAIVFPICEYVAAQNTHKGPTHVAGQRFMAWCASVGLNTTVKFVEEAYREHNMYSLTVSVKDLEKVIGGSGAADVYERLYLKLLSMSDVRPLGVTLKILADQGGWCGPGATETVLALDAAGVSRRSKVVRQGGRILCSLDFEWIQQQKSRILAEYQHMNSATAPPFSIESERRATAGMLKEWLHNRYANVGADVTVTGENDTWLSLLVTKMQGEIIRPARYWERLQLFVFVEHIETATRIRLIVDAKYGAGLNQPDEQGYTDMEPTYTSSLLTYGKQLLLQLAEVK
jgi:hypothetical protein